MNDQELIQRTIELARLGLGSTWPNPLVGSVIVKNGRVIGEGYHHRYGEHHAEIDALKNCSESPEGSTLYVNLEPCCHTNKQTPPCAQRLIQEKIKKVVICNLDPNPSVNGKGVEILREAGIEVVYGILTEEGEALNEVFFHNQKTGLPFIHLKMASTLDGRIALPSGESQWITGASAREDVHHLRSTHQAVAVGAETLRKDNPKLNVRLENFKGDSPYRIVFTESGNLPKDANLFNDELRDKTLIYTRSPLTIPLPSSQIIQFETLEGALRDLYKKKIINILLEGGARLSSSFMKEGFVNRVSYYLSPSFLGAGPSAVADFGLTRLNERPRLRQINTTSLGEDILVSGRLN